MSRDEVAGLVKARLEEIKRKDGFVYFDRNMTTKNQKEAKERGERASERNIVTLIPLGSDNTEGPDRLFLNAAHRKSLSLTISRDGRELTYIGVVTDGYKIIEGEEVIIGSAIISEPIGPEVPVILQDPKNVETYEKTHQPPETELDSAAFDEAPTVLPIP